MNVKRISQHANLIARWCGVRSVATLAKQELEEKCLLADGTADLFVLFGGGVVGSVEVLAHAMQSGVARRYAIVGGRGHATYWLDRAFRCEIESNEGAQGLAEPGRSSEAQMLETLLELRHGLNADFLETRSTNCGNNISYLMDLLETEAFVPKSVILCQDAVMQRRMEATWERQVRDRPAFADTRVISWASYEATLGESAGKLVWLDAPEGIWTCDAYLRLLIGEVSRLSDAQTGYGPRGRDYIAHVDVPSSVTIAAQYLQEELGGLDRPPDSRYA